MPKKNLVEVEPEPTPEPEPEPVEEEILSEDEEIEIKKPTKRAVKKEESVKRPPKPPPGCIQPKKPRERTQAQKDAWARCLEARQAKRSERAQVREGYNEELKKYKQHLEEKKEKKVVKKAIAIKKKVDTAMEVLDEISDDETPIEVVKEKIKQRRAAAKPKPKPEPDTRYQYMTQPELYVPTIRFI